MISFQKSQRIIVFLLMLLLLSACGPSDRDFQEALFPNGRDAFGRVVTNVSIDRKGDCGQISATNRARGVTKAWIVSYSYDLHVDNYIGAYEPGIYREQGTEVLGLIDGQLVSMWTYSAVSCP